MNYYKALNKQKFSNENFSIVPIRQDDLLDIMIWRNEQIDVLRQKKIITISEQNIYYNTVLLPTLSEQFPNQIIFSYLKDNVLIGYGGLVHISWEDKRSEMSFLLNSEYVKNDAIYEQYFLKFISLLKEVNFCQLNFHKLFTETYSHRSFHISILEKAGFELEGVLKDHVLIENIYFNSLIHSIINNV